MIIKTGIETVSDAIFTKSLMIHFKPQCLDIHKTLSFIFYLLDVELRFGIVS